ncbi:MAG: SulP family inorganic anion transporter [Pseudomonadota bacterium]
MKFFSNLKYDLPASIIVFFVALPLCLGIALASGAPLFSGIIAGIVGGVLVGALSGSALGVSGPAAGLATIVLAYIITLGGSWEAFLLVVMVAGMIQIIMGFIGLGTIAYYFPSSVIKGMLSGIGLIIIIKQIPHSIGYDFNSTQDFSLESLNLGSCIFDPQTTCIFFNEGAALISIISLLMLILWEGVLAKKYRFFKAVPAPLAMVVLGIIFTNLFANGFLPFTLAAEHLVKIPLASNAGEFFGQFSRPDFSQISNPQIYWMALVLAIIASLETLLSTEACDKLDPQKRVTPTNRELKAQGVGNIISGLIGGLPITQVIVRSSANVTFGAKTKLSAILHGLILLGAIIAIPTLLNMIPLASLACVLLAVGYKLAKPSLFKQMYQLGFEQFIPFIITIVTMIFTDLLTGVGLGMAVALLYLIYHNFCNAYVQIKDDQNQPDQHIFKLAEEVSFLNKGRILKMLSEIPANSKVIIDGRASKVIHHDVIEIIKDFQISSPAKNITLELQGIDLASSK